MSFMWQDLQTRARRVVSRQRGEPLLANHCRWLAALDLTAYSREFRDRAKCSLGC